MANELRAASGLNFGAFQPAHGKPGAWFKSASAPTGNTLMHRLLSVSDGLVTLAGKKLVFSTNLDRPSQVDAALLRPGRCFDVLAFRLLDYCEACALAEAAGVKAPSDPARRYSAAEVFHAGAMRAGPHRLRRPAGFV